jgi:hypothetical protein
MRWAGVVAGTVALVWLAALPAAAQPVPEQILDDADWEPLAALPPDSAYRAAARPVGRLRVTVRLSGGGEGELCCTAVLVAPELALTAQHCVPGRYGVRAMAATLELGAPGEISRFAADIAPVEASSTLDYSLLRIEGHPGERFGWARPASRPARQGEELYVVHFPQGRAPMLTRRNCRVYRSTATDFVHSCDTAWGSSGAPLFSETTGTVVGLHVAGSRAANYGKQVVALFVVSPVLASLAGVDRSSVTRLESTSREDNSGLAVEAERLLERKMREAVAALAAVAGRSPSPTESSTTQPSKTPSPEPYLRWDTQSRRPGSPQ